METELHAEYGMLCRVKYCKARDKLQENMYNELAMKMTVRPRGLLVSIVPDVIGYPGGRFADMDGQID